MAQKHIEQGLSINKFDKPTVYTDAMALASQFKNILLMKPGTYPTAPEMGFNLTGYRFDLLDDALISDMLVKLEEQIANYIPALQGAPIDIIQLTDSSGYVDGVAIGISIQSSTFMVTGKTISESGEVVTELVKL